MSRIHVVLVPGFFGFANLGDLAYFGHVHAFLRDAYVARGHEPALHVVHTSPTASLPQRAALIVDALAADASDDAPIHVVGHSSGGLDARLLLSPGVVLPTRHDVEAFARRVTHALAVATPHRGTPLATFFATRLGANLLELLSLATMGLLRFGRAPLSALLAIGAAYARLDDLGPNSRLLDQIFHDLLENFTPERRAAITTFLAAMRDDRALLTQLMPESMQVFAATIRDRPGVRYGAIVTRAVPPSLASFLMPGLDPTAHVSHLVYRALHAAAADRAARLPSLDASAVAALRAAYGGLPDPSDSDGVVPTLSQVYGEVVHVTRSDHLDVIGHFGDPSTEPPHFDWLVTGSGYDRARFEATWTAAADYLTAARPASAARSAESPP